MLQSALLRRRLQEPHSSLDALGIQCGPRLTERRPQLVPCDEPCRPGVLHAPEQTAVQAAVGVNNILVCRHDGCDKERPMASGEIPCELRRGRDVEQRQ